MSNTKTNTAVERAQEIIGEEATVHVVERPTQNLPDSVFPPNWNFLSMKERGAYLQNLGKAMAGKAKGKAADFDPETVEIKIGDAYGVALASGGRRDVYISTMQKQFDPRLQARMIRFALANKNNIVVQYDKDLFAKDAIGHADTAKRSAALERLIDPNHASWTEFETWANRMLPALDAASDLLTS